MKWWKKWKARHWDETVHPEYMGPIGWGPEWREAPRFRAFVFRFLHDCENQPIKAFGIVGGVIIGILGAIAAIIRSLC